MDIHQYSHSHNYSPYEIVSRLPEGDSPSGALHFSDLYDTEMKGRSHMKANRPLIVVSIIFIIIIVIVGAVVWKVTKDAYGVSAPSAIAGHPTTSRPVTDPPGTGITTRTYTPEELKEQPWLSLRMSRDVLPVHYDITMFPDFYGTAGQFYGNETVEVIVAHPTRHFLLHVHTLYMNVTRSQLVDNVTGEDIEISRTFYYLPNEFFVIESKTVVDRPVKIKLQFEGSLTKAIYGIYKSTYLNTQTNEIRQLAASKFEPTYARRAFPCFDEPNMKAEFTITLVHRPEYIALSNMPQDGQANSFSLISGMVASKFQRSVKMSTYLVCFVVCDFKYTETRSTSGILIRVYATPDKVNQTHYALEMARHTLDEYEVLFNMSYPLPKQDLIAIPDFVSGAMEHWGLITFRESRLLYSPGQSSVANQENIALVVAHEMAHMWFGNIVTMDWWDDLWLNEGFANYMEYVGVDSKEVDWDIMNKFLDSDLFSVMTEDAQTSSHPIVVQVHVPSQITSVFDAISYSKGSSVIRMLESIMGKDTFFKGVSNYLQKHKWENAVTDDLWESLSNVNNRYNVKHIMDTWTIQDGFPYINISVRSDTSGNTIVTATQRRFLSNPMVDVNEDASPFNYKWYVALDYLSSGGVNGTEVMDMKNIEFTKNFMFSQANNSWIKFNHRQMGYYVVLYPEVMWKSFSNYLQQTHYTRWMLPSADRAGLLHDAFMMAAVGWASYQIPLEMMSYLDEEREYLPWSTALKFGTNYLHQMLQLDADYTRWKKFLAARIGPSLDRLGFEDIGSYSERNLRAILMNEACTLQLPTTVNNVTQKFRDWLDNNIRPSVNIKSVIYRFGMWFGGTEDDWETVWRKYLVEPSPQEKESLASCLTSTHQPHLIARLLENAKNQNGIKSQDFFTLVSRLASNTAAKGLLWDWTRENYQSFIDRFTISDRSFGQMIYVIARNFNTEFKLKEVKDFLAQYPKAGAAARHRKMTVERIEKNIAWMKAYRSHIVDWLKTKT
ncbi:unnamed protein product [Lymnaea stagnalis]|uniref:glutamyl aminopeptidase n=1 Tax=Lymnaea stagnalis TaxID=6523 RepID=A0AAV2H4E6_LYMST